MELELSPCLHRLVDHKHVSHLSILRSLPAWCCLQPFILRQWLSCLSDERRQAVLHESMSWLQHGIIKPYIGTLSPLSCSHPPKFIQ